MSLPSTDVLDNPPGRGRALQYPPFFQRYLPPWSNPKTNDANTWRHIVRHQPIAIACRDTLISFIVGTEWQVRAKDANETSSLLDDVDYYTRFLEEAGGIGFDNFMDIVCQDILDTPFGAGAEIGRLGDKPKGHAVWVQHIDSATLYPTLDPNFPVAQRLPEVQHAPVMFPRHAINRAYISPRPEFKERGWGMPPPEKIYLAIELLVRGDRYYANLLLDTPEAGILDVMDMKKDTAMEWLKSFKELFVGADPFKVPVLYEHETPAKFLPFGRPPTEMIFNEVTFKYAQVVCSGYGLRVSDIGLSREEARTLAGVIRAERQTRRTGFAVLKAKTAAFWNRILPPYLVFEWVDKDDESMVAKGRARLTNAQAYGELREKKILHLEEIRAQLEADDLLDVPIDPDDIAGLEVIDISANGGAGGARAPDETRPRVPPSQGGEGELTRTPRKTRSASDIVERAVRSMLESKREKILSIRIRRLSKAYIREIFPGVSEAFEEMSSGDIDAWGDAMVQLAFGENEALEGLEGFAASNREAMDPHLESDPWWRFDSPEMLEAIKGVAEDTFLALGQYVISSFYEEGLRDDPGDLPGVEIEEEDTLSSLADLEQQMREEYSSRLKEGVKSIISASVCRLMSDTYHSEDEIEEEDLSSNEAFMQAVVLEVEEALNAFLTIRARQWTEELLYRTSSWATFHFFYKNGVEGAVWETDGGNFAVDKAKLLTMNPEDIWIGGSNGQEKH